MGLIYKPLEDFSEEEINQALERNILEELIVLPLAVGQNFPKWKFAQDVCIKLSEHDDPRVRANAILGLAYIARTKGNLDKRIVKPVILKELRANEEYKWRIIDAIEDINIFMNWDMGKNALEDSE